MTRTKHLQAADIAVVVNLSDPLSVAIGDYYLERRAIPASNLARVRFDYRRDALPPGEFTALRAAVERQLPARVQAYALTWARPYRVGCMSITSAFTFGADQEDYCIPGCKPTRRSSYFNSSVRRPYDELGMRPSMSIAASDLPQARELIDRGVRSDGLAPEGTAYLVITDDRPRNVRSIEYPLAIRVAQYELNFRVSAGRAPVDPADVMFYFTGAAQVAGIDGVHFLPGAVADHLTSYGGMLTDSPQMSSLQWLAAGATGSYGTVVEPCALTGKFPDVPVLLAHYLGGATLIEAYWKSVLMPGQGLFIGEPLAAPFAPAPPASE
ncbi:MAG: TIGR03790 family protein [Gammaproteobacteria bacterium]|nr:TIGR03790 family protein [Gammaproteobacteria bacterium]MBV8403407.1 TIGR03790 family protein [Gammaproteobacteria bacterium]